MVGRAELLSAIFLLLSLMVYSVAAYEDRQGVYACHCIKYDYLFSLYQLIRKRHQLCLCAVLNVCVVGWVWVITSLVLAVCSVLSKEQGIMTTPTCLVYEITLVRKVRWWSMLIVDALMCLS